MESEARLAPIDEATGVPLPIAPAHVPPGKIQGWNRHHTFYERSRYENGTEGLRAVRFSRLQCAPIWLHNRFHVAYRGGVVPPESEFEEFKLTVLGYAGYLPESAVDVSRVEPVIKHLSRRERHELRRPGIFQTEDKDFQNRIIGGFLVGYALKNGIEVVRQDVISKFLGTESREKREQLGLKIIEAAAEAVSEPFDIMYSTAKKRRLLHHGVPNCPEGLVIKHLKDKVPGYTKLIANTLASVVD